MRVSQKFKPGGFGNGGDGSLAVGGGQDQVYRQIQQLFQAHFADEFFAQGNGVWRFHIQVHITPAPLQIEARAEEPHTCIWPQMEEQALAHLRQLARAEPGVVKGGGCGRHT